MPTDTAGAIPEWVRYAFWGSVAGLVVGLAALFVAAVSYGEALGLSLAACAAVGCTLTVLFSQPAALAGMLAGALVGVAIGVVVYHRHHSSRVV